MRESPRIRRLRTDLKALEQLKRDSSILDFEAHGDPPEAYVVRFSGRGFYSPEGTRDVKICERHEVRIELGAAYPRNVPELTWLTPIFHPNISGSGLVCLGGYGTFWVPSLNLDELCEMLWDMIRYKNFDIGSPYNRAAAAWAKQQQRYDLPIDARNLRDQLAAAEPPAALAGGEPSRDPLPCGAADELLVIDASEDAAQPEGVEAEGGDILFLE